VFLIANRIGQDRQTHPGESSAYLTWEQVRYLMKQGITFGSHTFSHANLLQISSSQLWEECSSSKKTIEENIDQAVDYIAYPYGKTNPQVQEAARQCGYRGALGVDHGALNPFNLWRNTCRGGDGMFGFRLLLNRLYHIKAIVREETAFGKAYKWAKAARINRHK
jgi:peptidoglycan/xylan/chitin deacetylase (PgdA/CDA1 family)